MCWHVLSQQLKASYTVAEGLIHLQVMCWHVLSQHNLIQEFDLDHIKLLNFLRQVFALSLSLCRCLSLSPLSHSLPLPLPLYQAPQLPAPGVEFSHSYAML
jgi:hypothetical protein